MIRRPPRSTRPDTLFPYRRSSDRRAVAPADRVHPREVRAARREAQQQAAGHHADHRSQYHAGIDAPEFDDARNDRRAEFLARPQCTGAPLAAKGSAMLEVFTVGGGEYLVNTFNAVAAWSGGGGYKSLIRSEEHTAELQSLMRISYAVFCLNTKKNQEY